ncbi:MAG: DNA repair protein RecN [Bacteroidota bacterium]
MLKSLYISNFVIINEIELSFSSGFSAITGETGSGKSILLDALSLLFGKRADLDVLRKKDKKTIVEGIFSNANNKAADQWLRQQEIDQIEEIILRREIGHNGKSRAFINDTPVTLQQLKTLSRMLIDVHQQFDTQEIGNSNFQREVLDAVANCNNDAVAFNKKFNAYSNKLNQKKELDDKLNQLKETSSYKQFLLEELTETQLRSGEDQELEQQWAMMKETDAVSTVLNESQHLLNEGNLPLLNQLKKISSRLSEFSHLHPKFKEAATRLHSVWIELDDIANELEHLKSLVDHNEEQKNKVQDRLELLYRLMKKHQVNSLDALLDIKETLLQHDQMLLSIENECKEKEKELNILLYELKTDAEILHQKRIKETPSLQKKINQILLQIGMPHARIKIEITATEINPYGTDRIDFLFNANVPTGVSDDAVHFEPIDKVASGGELSRLMLSVQSLVAEKIQLPTLIFDEIDSGISGEAAIQVSQLLTTISNHHQIIAITHLPQVAAKAKAHYLVSKKEQQGQIVADIRQLNHDERIDTLASMLGGKGATESSRKTAKELMGRL